MFPDSVVDRESGNNTGQGIGDLELSENTFPFQLYTVQILFIPTIFQNLFAGKRQETSRATSFPGTLIFLPSQSKRGEKMRYPGTEAAAST